MFRDELTSLIASIRKACDPLIVLPGPYFMTDYEGYERFDKASPDVFESFNLITEQVALATGSLFCDVYHAYGGAPWMVALLGAGLMRGSVEM